MKLKPNGWNPPSKASLAFMGQLHGPPSLPQNQAQAFSEFHVNFVIHPQE